MNKDESITYRDEIFNYKNKHYTVNSLPTVNCCHECGAHTYYIGHIGDSRIKLKINCRDYVIYQCIDCGSLFKTKKKERKSNNDFILYLKNYTDKSELSSDLVLLILSYNEKLHPYIKILPFSVRLQLILTIVNCAIEFATNLYRDSKNNTNKKSAEKIKQLKNLT